MALLRYDGKRFIWSGGYETKDLPKQAGFRWDPERRVWWTSFEDQAARLAQYAEPPLRSRLEWVLTFRSQSLEQSRAAAAEIDIPKPDGLNYLPFQLAGIRYALSRKDVLIGDEMGLGKTIQAIGVINAGPPPNHVLVIVPASLKINWYRELTRWLVHPLPVQIVASGSSVPDRGVVIINYDIVGKHKDTLMAYHWDYLIVDEAHYLKNPQAQRTQHLLGADKRERDGRWTHLPGIVDRAERRLFLTGTPVLNRPIELWGIAHTLAPEAFPSFMGYAKRYCAAQQSMYGWDFSGASNLSELEQTLRSHFMIRRLKRDVLQELPAKVRQVIEIDAAPGDALIREERRLFGAMEADIAARRAEVELARASGDQNEYRTAVARLRDTARVAFQEMSEVRHRLALAKVPAAIEFIRDALESEDKLVVFAHHRDVAHRIADQFGGEAVCVDGETSLGDRQAAVDAFQQDPQVHLFVGTIGAAGVGLTLTAASHVVFVELDWVPGNVTQAEDRLHRIGQHNSVLVQHLVFDGSLDARMAKVLVAKQQVIDAALDDDVPPITPLDDGDLETERHPRQQRPNREEDEPPLSDDEVARIHNQLRTLAGVCDGAIARDGEGFNAVDAQIGYALARLSSLSQRQAQLGRRILRKYSRQLGEVAG